VLPVAQALRVGGIDPLELCEEVGIDMARAANPDWRVPRDRFNALLERAVVLTGDEAFGLAAAEQLQPQVLQALGLAWLASDTVYDGLRRMARFARFVSTGASMVLEEEGEYLHAVFVSAPGTGGRSWTGHDYAVGIVVRMCQLTLGDFLPPLRVTIDRPHPRVAARWEYMLASRVTFDAAETRITWPLSEVLEPLVTGDPTLARVNDELAQGYLDGFLGRSTVRDVMDHIVRLLPDGAPGQDQVAGALHMSSRTLQRKLREEDTSFTELLQQARLDLARRYLGDQRRSVVETAYLLGFSEPSTFSRAFKRWTGMAPAEYREAA